MLLSVLNQKGGTGKTTIAINLSVMYARDNKKILLVDADNQGSAKAWVDIRPDNLKKIDVLNITTPDIGREIEPLQKKYDIIIIDGGGRITATARACILISDFILIPTMVSVPDVLATQHFLNEVISEATKIKKVTGAIIATMIKQGTTFNISGLTQIKKMEYPVLDTTISHRIIYQESFSEGKGVIEYQKEGKASEEIIKLYKEIKKIQKT